MFARWLLITVSTLPLLVNTAHARDAAPIKATAQKTEQVESTYELLNLFGDVFERIKSDYVEEVTDKKLVESAINGMLTSLDPHSSYLDDKSFKEMQVQTKGEFGGLGIEVTMENGVVKVVSPIDDTPAFKAGVKAGDYITMIDNEQIMGMTLNDAVTKMRGKVGTKIKLTIVREGQSEPIELSITRDVIRIQSIRAHAEGDIGYVRITSFSEQTAAGLEEAVAKLKSEIKNIKGLVLDLRNNPGGLLDQAIEVSDAFLEKGEIVSTRDRNPENTKRYGATAGDIINGLPLVVLINNGSASASEIVAGALQDQKRAVILGTKSFGKGSVQTLIPLKDHGAIKLTTSRYYTPSGRSIQAKGIEPDIAVEAAKLVAVSNGLDRSEADLRGRLANDDEKKAAKILNLDEVPFSKENNGHDSNKGKNKDKDASHNEPTGKEDFQLARAIDLIQGLSVYSTLKEK
jgi:carboxyl-terminal processing protease